MLCPLCLTDAPEFPRIPNRSVRRCPACDGEIPLAYPHLYAQHPAVPVAIIGPRGHGKTAYIEALLTHLETRIPWDDFACTWIDQNGLRETRERLRRLREFGEMPDASLEVFPTPQVVRLQRVPRVGGCQLVFYDTGGEVFTDIESFQDAGRYVAQCKVVVWLVSLTDLRHRQELSDLMTVYRTAVLAMDADPKEQTVILALTKGDVLNDRTAAHQYHSLPDTARDFLDNDDLDPDGDAWGRLQKVSDAIRDWLPTVGQKQLVNLLKEEFKDVRYCILSSLGSTPPETDDETKFEPAPRGVLAPLFWVWQETLAGVVVEHRKGRDTYFGLPDAVAAAPPGATVRLRAGTSVLTDPLQITKPLRIVGAGADQTVVTSAAKPFAVGTRVEPGQEVSFTGMTIEHTGPATGDVVAAFGGGLALTDCVVRGGVVGPEPKAGTGCGVVACKGASATLTKCVVRDNGGHGVHASGDGRLGATGCEFRGNTKDGAFLKSAAASLTGCRAVENQLSGVRVTGQCVADVRDCSAGKNKLSGLLADDDAEVTFSNNTCSENDHDGIALKDRAVVTLTRNKCLQNKQSGIAVHDNVSGTIGSADVAEDKNECSNNKKDGIEVGDEAAPAVVGNECRGNSRAGVRYSGTGSGHCLRNACRANRLVGVEVAENANPVVSGNTAQGTVKGPGFRIAPPGHPGFQFDNVSGDDNFAEDEVPPPPKAKPPARKRWPFTGS